MLRKKSKNPSIKESNHQKMNMLKFFKEVRQEGSKVTWASKQETMSVTMMVFIMVAVSSAFFLVADWLLYHGVQYLLKF